MLFLGDCTSHHSRTWSNLSKAFSANPKTQDMTNLKRAVSRFGATGREVRANPHVNCLGRDNLRHLFHVLPRVLWLKGHFTVCQS